MVALKSDSVWTNLSRFGRPYPPFDYGSGMGVEDVDREEAIELGLLPADEPSDEIPDFDIRLEAEVSLDRIPEDMLDSIIKETPNARIEGGKLKMSDKKPLPTWKDLELEDTKKWKPSGIKFSRYSIQTAKQDLKSGESSALLSGKLGQRGCFKGLAEIQRRSRKRQTLLLWSCETDSGKCPRSMEAGQSNDIGKHL